MSPSARRIRLDLAYDGTDFAGWQLQPRQRTVQGVLEQVLSELQGGGRVCVRGAGRTDSGVHARHQVADCEIRSRLDDAGLGHALRCMLPADVRPLYVATVAASFHSQKAAIGKTYRYRLDTTPHGDPFEARYAWHVARRIDDRLLEACLAQLPGRRDWSGFAGSRCDKLDRVRSLSVARLDRSAEGRAELTFRADGFLHHMVRNLVGTLLEIATGRMAPATIRAVLSSGDRNRAGPTAPARGLWLMRVHYAADEDPGAAATGGGRSE